jgi:UDP-N-acetyl-2-amino-2-deoxyglucuronate dehydrogenase
VTAAHMGLRVVVDNERIPIFNPCVAGRQKLAFLSTVARIIDGKCFVDGNIFERSRLNPSSGKVAYLEDVAGGPGGAFRGLVFQSAVGSIRGKKTLRDWEQFFMKTIGIGMVGSGYMALTYSEAIAKHNKGAHLVAIAGGHRAASLASDYDVAGEPTVEALLARSDVDAIILTTPDQYHCEQTLSAAAAGKHVLVEKPMAPSVAQCNQMIAACEAAGVKLAVVKTERYRSLTKRAKQLIDEGAIGEIWMVRTVSVYPITFGDMIFSTRPWYGDPAGGGLFVSIASHNTDFLSWIIGSPAKQVYAQARTYSHLKAPAQSVMAQISYANGVIGHMWTSSELPTPSMPASEVRFQVVGSKGMLDFENYEFLDLGRGDKWERVFVPQRFDYLNDPKSPIRLEPHIGVVQEFIDSIREHRPPRVPGEAGRAAVEVCEACLRSSAESRAIDLPLSA